MFINIRWVTTVLNCLIPRRWILIFVRSTSSPLDSFIPALQISIGICSVWLKSFDTTYSKFSLLKLQEVNMPTEDPDSQLKKEPYESCLKQKMAESRGSSSRLMLLFLTLIYTQGPDPQIIFREDVHVRTYLPYIRGYPLNILIHLRWGWIGSSYPPLSWCSKM